MRRASCGPTSGRMQTPDVVLTPRVAEGLVSPETRKGRPVSASGRKVSLNGGANHMALVGEAVAQTVGEPGSPLSPREVSYQGKERVAVGMAKACSFIGSA